MFKRTHDGDTTIDTGAIVWGGTEIPARILTDAAGAVRVEIRPIEQPKGKGKAAPSKDWRAAGHAIATTTIAAAKVKS